MSAPSRLAFVLLFAVAGCSLLLRPGGLDLPPDDDADTDADADADVGAEVDADGDGDGDGDAGADADAEVTEDGDVEEDADVPVICEVVPSALDLDALLLAGCPTLDDPTLTDVVIPARGDPSRRQCSLDTATCALDCDDIALDVPHCFADDGLGTLCVLVVRSLEVLGRTDAWGPHRLAILAAESINIDNELDADGSQPWAGPGGHAGGDGRGDDGFGPAPGIGDTSNNGGGGGGGRTGHGGDGGCEGGLGGARAFGDSHCDRFELLGAGGGGGGSGAGGGGGGGALYLFARNSIEVTPNGEIDVDGGDGETVEVDRRDGAGGAGGGGSLLLEAPRIIDGGEVETRGGRGGAGRDWSEWGGQRGDIGGDVGGELDGGDGGCRGGTGGGGGGGCGHTMIRTDPGGYIETATRNEVMTRDALCFLEELERVCRPDME